MSMWVTKWTMAMKRTTMSRSPTVAALRSWGIRIKGSSELSHFDVISLSLLASVSLTQVMIAAFSCSQDINLHFSFTIHIWLE